MWNEKEVHGLDAGYNMWPWPLISLMTLTLDVSRSNFEIARRNCWSDWCEMKMKWVNMTLGRLYDLALWPHPWPWPWVKISRSKSEIALSQEWYGRLTWNEKYVSHPFMTMILTSVTMVGWADVPDNDWGDFRHRRAIDISSWKLVQRLVSFSSKVAKLFALESNRWLSARL